MTKDKPPVVTAIIPCHNHGDTVWRAIDSVVLQDYPEKRVFVSDEGSADNTWKALTDVSRWADPLELLDENEDGRQVMFGKYNDMDIYVVKQPNGDGPSPARNRLIKMAWDTTDLFIMLDADDYYLPGKITKNVQAWANDPKLIGLVYNDAIIHNDKTGTDVYEYREPYSRARLERECITGNTPLVSKAAFQTAGLYDEEMRTAEDWDLALRITASFVAVHVPEALNVYSVTGQNCSDTVDPEIWQKNWQRIYAKIQQQKSG